MEPREVPNHWKGRCFGCSTLNSHGLRLRFFMSEDGCFTKCTIPEHLCGIDGVVHGGIVALLLDEIAEWTMVARLGRMGVTSDLSVRYLHPVPTGVELTVEGRIDSHDDKRVTLSSFVRSADGRELAQARTEWRLVRPPVIAKLSKIEPGALQTFLSHYPVAYRS